MPDRPAGGRCQSSRPPPAARNIPGDRHANAQPGLLFSFRESLDGSRLRLSPSRSSHHGTIAARHLHPIQSRRDARQHPVPCATALARQVRRPASPLPGHNRRRLQSAPDVSRHYPRCERRCYGAPCHRSELSRYGRRQTRRRRRHPGHASPDVPAGVATLPSPRKCSRRKRW